MFVCRWLGLRMKYYWNQKLDQQNMVGLKKLSPKSIPSSTIKSTSHLELFRYHVRTKNWMLSFLPFSLPAFLPSCLPAFLPSLPAFLPSCLPAFLLSNNLLLIPKICVLVLIMCLISSPWVVANVLEYGVVAEPFRAQAMLRAQHLFL